MASASIPSPRGGGRGGSDAVTGKDRKLLDRLGDPGFKGLSLVVAGLSVVLILLLIYQVFELASESISHFGVSFLGASVWNPVTQEYGAASFIYGTAITSAVALLIAAPMSIAIAIYLTELAPRRARRPVAMLVELLAAIPSVILGLWGIIVLNPILFNHVEHWLHAVLGWIPLFGGEPSPSGLLPAVVILTIMTIPIVSAVTREVFETVPGELKESALALGATRWEMVRMVVLPYSRPGIVGASILGLSRALGEAIAVTQVIGGGFLIHASLYQPSDTLASKIAATYQSATSPLTRSSLAYLAVILLVIALVVNIIARRIVGGNDRRMARAARRASPAAAPADPPEGGDIVGVRA